MLLIEELVGSQARRAHLLPVNVHRTPQGRYVGRFNYGGHRWYAGTHATLAISCCNKTLDCALDC
jgi:hypothetical protein